MKYLCEIILVASGFSRVVLADPAITTFPNSLTLSESFDPIKAAYWTGLPHHRRTPFSVSPDGQSAYLAYLDSTYANVVVQEVDLTTFEAVGSPYSTVGYEAAGLVAQNDGFALLATVNATGSTDLPPDNAPIVSLIRVQSGTEVWRTALNGPGVHESEGLSCTPDANGDLVYSSTAGLYAAYFVVEAYSGDASGHFGDSIQYVDDDGTLQDNNAYASTFGCSHNTGIGFEAADAAPFASICAEDQGDIWLNTNTQYMSGVKISNENTTNGCSGEPMGGMSGSYSNLARFPSTTNYIFAWQSRGAVDLKENSWMGDGHTTADPRWLVHNVAISTMSDKDTLTGSEATSVVGAVDGDSQINWITNSSTVDHQNVHVAAFNTELSIVTWETLTDPDCQPLPLECSGTYTGTSFQLVDKTGTKSGDAVVSTDVFVSGDIATIDDSTVCWPYVDMTWDLSAPLSSGSLVTKMSFACASIDSSGSVASSSTVASSTSAVLSTSIASSSAVVSSVIMPSSTISSNTITMPSSTSIGISSDAQSSAPASVPTSVSVLISSSTSAPLSVSTAPVSPLSPVSSVAFTESSIASLPTAVDNTSSAVSVVSTLPKATVTVIGSHCQRKRQVNFVA